MIRKLIALLLTLLFTLSVLPASAQQALAVTDMIGREVSVEPGSYRRVACIGAGALRLYAYVGEAELLCGVEDIDNATLAERPKMFDGVARPYEIALRDTLSALPSCGVGGPNAQAAEAEKVLACAPDIVISEYEDVEKADALQAQLGVPVITLRMGPGGVFDEAFAGSLRLLGEVFQREGRAEELIAFVNSQRAEIESRTEGQPDENAPGVYICGLGNWGTTNHLMTAERYLPFEVAGVRNVVSGLSAPGIQPIDEEKFASLGEEMDIMILDAAAVKNIRPLYAENPAMFEGCKAWREGKVFLQMAYNAYYTNCEIALVNTWFLGKCVYPEAFSDIDIVQKTREVTKAFLGEDQAEAIFAYPNSFGGYQQIDTKTFFG